MAVAAVPLLWSLLAASDALWAVALQIALIGGSFLVGYHFNERRIPARFLVLVGFALMVLTAALLLSADGIYMWTLIGLFGVGTVLDSAGIGTLVRRMATSRLPTHEPESLQV